MFRRDSCFGRWRSGGLFGDQHCYNKDEDVCGDSAPYCSAQPQLRQQYQTRHCGPANCSECIYRIQATDATTYLIIAGYYIACQHWQGRTHAGCRHNQHRKCDDKVK